MIVLCQELVNEQRDVHVRMAAGLSVKNSLVSKDADRRARLGEKWRGLGCSVRTQIKQLVLQGLTAQDGKAGTAAAQVVSAIAFIELPLDEWPELMGVLLDNVTGAGRSAGVRRATLEAIGFICEQIDPEVLQAKSSEVLTAVINGLRSAEASTSVRVAAAHALLNSVDFIRRHFESATEAAVIMQVVCEATISPDEVLAVAAFECLNELVRVYYELMGPFIPAGVAQMAIGVLGSSQSDPILLQATEFWSTLAEIERDLDPALSSLGATDSLYFVRRFCPELLPALLRLLQQQPSEESTDEWCPSMAASTCLGLVAEALGDSILQDKAIPTFIEANINGSNWRQRESSVMALGSILDGPQTDVLGPLIGSLTRKLLELLANDQSVAVQDSAAWALGRICDFHLSAVPSDLLPVILQGLVHCLSLAPRVSVNCCWSLMTLCTHLGAEDDSVPSSEVSALFDSITGRLIGTADRADADECNLRSAAYQSLAAVLLNAPADMIPAVSAFQEPLLLRLETALGHLSTAVVNADDRNRLVDLLSHLCTVMQSAIKKCRGPKTIQVADRTMQVALSLLQAGTATANTTTTGAELEDVLLLVGVLASEMEQDFVRFYSFLLPVLCACIGRHEETAFCMVAVGVVGDLARSLGPLLQPQTDQLMMALLEGLNSSNLHRSVKPHIISAIGDICLAIGSAFQPYLTLTATFLQQAATILPADQDDYDEIDFCLSLRESLLEAYTCIVQGIRQDSDGSALAPLLPSILAFLQLAAADPDRSEGMARSVAGLLGDLVDAFPSHAASLKAPWVSAFLQRPLPDGPPSPQTVAVIQWAHQQLFSSSH